MRPPTSPREVLQFCNMVGFYSMLIPDFAKRVAPLQRLTQGIRVAISGKRKKGAIRAALMHKGDAWEWGPDQVAAFTDLKRALTSPPVVRGPDYREPFLVRTDASKEGFGAVLSQEFIYPGADGEDGRRQHPICFISRTTTASERRYSPHLLELAATKWALERLQRYIWCNPVYIIGDCKALEGTLLAKTLPLAHDRWQEAILGFDIRGFIH